MLAPDPFDLLTKHARLYGLKRQVEPLHCVIGESAKLIRRIFPQIRSAGQWRVVTVAAGRQLQIHSLLVFIRFVGPSEMRRGSLFACRHHRHDGGIITTKFRCTGHLSMVNRGNSITFPNARRKFVQGGLHHLFGDFTGLLHVGDFLIGLYNPHPGNQQITVFKARPGQVFLQFNEPAGAEIVGIHLNADGAVVPAPAFDLVGHKVHGVLDRGLDIIIGIADDVILG